ncbi:MAG: flagellar assembly protein FliW [Firmicutes bacterium]|nr:flagellar assembly protein FliW [Bacillota bacterium]
MKLETKNFGELTYDENDVIHFDLGLPGFKDNKYFLLLANTPNDLISWLQSTENGDLAFVLMNVKQVLPSYDPIIDEGELMDFQVEDTEESRKNIFIYNIAFVPEDIKETRVNLQAPILINPVTRKGRQVVVTNEEYGLRHYIFSDENIGNIKDNPTETAG